MMRFLLTAFFLLASAIPAIAQKTDSTHFKLAKIIDDSIKAELCRGGTYSTNGLTCYNQKLAPRVTVLRRLRIRQDSLEKAHVAGGVVTPPPPPGNQPPVASFTVTWSGTTATLDGSGSTDDKGVVSYEWRASDPSRPPKYTATITRGWGSTDQPYTDTLYVKDVEGLVAFTTRYISGPPTAPPPTPIGLPTPTTTSPGDLTAPGPVISLTPTFVWSPVAGATGYVLAIRDVATGVIVYPSSTGVGTPIPATTFVLPAGVLVNGAAYRWDVTAVNSTSKSLASANRYFTTTPSTTPPPTTTIGAAELPRSIPPFSDPYPGRSCSQAVAAGGNITGALAAARGGSVVCVSPGADYAPIQLVCRAAGDTGWVVLRTDGPLPPEGTRIRPSAATLGRIVVPTNGAPAITTCPGAFGYFVRGIEITTGPGVTQTGDLVMLGTSGAAQDVMVEVPQRLVLSQVYIHGYDTGEIKRCVLLNSGATAIVDSWISNCHLAGQEGHGIGGWNGPGPHLIRNNFVEAAGINLFWGGATPSIPGMVAADVTIQRNHVYKPIAWKGRWVVKNLFETKNAVRVIAEGNVFDGSWESAQIGPAILFKSANDQGDCHWCRTTDVTFRLNYTKNAAQGIVFSGAENYNGGRVDTVARRFLIERSVFDSLGIPPYAHSTGGTRRIQIGTKASDIVFDRVVIHGKADDGSVFTLDPNNASPRTAFRNSVFSHGYYFVTGTSMALGLPGYEWTNMFIVRAAQLSAVPPGTTILTTENALAAQIRADVSAAVTGVVTPP